VGQLPISRITGQVPVAGHKRRSGKSTRAAESGWLAHLRRLHGSSVSTQASVRASERRYQEVLRLAALAQDSHPRRMLGCGWGTPGRRAN